MGLSVDFQAHRPPTCDQGLVCHGAPLDHFPVDGELSSGGDFDDVAPLDQLHHHLLLPEAHKHTCGHALSRWSGSSYRADGGLEPISPDDGVVRPHSDHSGVRGLKRH